MKSPDNNQQQGVSKSWHNDSMVASYQENFRQQIGDINFVQLSARTMQRDVDLIQYSSSSEESSEFNNLDEQLFVQQILINTLILQKADQQMDALEVQLIKLQKKVSKYNQNVFDHLTKLQTPIKLTQPQ